MVVHHNLYDMKFCPLQLLYKESVIHVSEAHLLSWDDEDKGYPITASLITVSHHGSISLNRLRMFLSGFADRVFKEVEEACDDRVVQ